MAPEEKLNKCPATRKLNNDNAHFGSCQHNKHFYVSLDKLKIENGGEDNLSPWP